MMMKVPCGQPGETYVDAANDVEIRVDSQTATGFVITIKNGEDPTVHARTYRQATSTPSSE